MSVVSTTISWCDATWSPIRGCSRVSTGCEQCYAERQAGRFGGPGQPYEGLVRRTSKGFVWTGEVRLIEKDLEVPLHWKRPRRIFVNPMSDLFHEAVPDAWIDRIFAVMGLAGVYQHIFQILTKRPERMSHYMQTAMPRVAQRMEDELGPFPEGIIWPLRRVWLGVSVENQATADERLPWLLKTPAAVRFVSYEPALGPVTFWKWSAWHERLEGPGIVHDYHRAPNTVHDSGEVVGDSAPGIDWIITGGESGPHARPCDEAWIHSVIEQCRMTDTSCWVKQMGTVWAKAHGCQDRKGADITEFPPDVQVQEFPYDASVRRPATV